LFAKIVKTPKEYTDALFVRKSVFVKEQQIPLEIEVDQNEEQAVHIVLYNDQEKPIAAGRYRILESIAKAERICVLPSERGNGSGSQIMEALEKHAAEQGLKHVKLSAQAHAIPFYEKLGYYAITEEYLEQNIPHKMMKKDL
jgi:predicted GNAT family N-acyltransferase